MSKKNYIFAAKFKRFTILMEKIDELDRKILKIITQSARIPFKDVAEQCGVSRAAVHRWCSLDRRKTCGIFTIKPSKG